MNRLWLLLLTLITGSVFAAAPAGSWWNTSYAYRQQIFIPAGTTPLSANYAVSVVFNHASHVSAIPSRSLATGNDVRVVRWNGSAWVDLNRVADPDAGWNTTTTRIWFETAANIAANATDDNYYIYYGNAAAGAPLASADSIFWLYDDFSSGGIAAARWDIASGVQNDNGELRMTTNSTVRSDASFGVDSIWEARARVTSTYGDFDFWGASAQSFLAYPLLMFQADTNSYQALARDIWITDIRSFAPVSPTSYQTYAFTREGTNIARFLINGSQVAAFNASEGPSGNLHIDLANNESGERMYYDWIRIRPYRNPDPVLSLGLPTTNSPVNHFVITHDGSGLNCAAETIGVSVRDSANAAYSGYAQQMTLNTQTGRGIWSLVSGSGTFNDGASNDGIATYTWPGTQSSATFSLSYPEGQSTFDIDVYQTSNTSLRDNDSEPNMTFAQSGFLLTSSLLPGNQGPPFPSFAAQTAGTTFPIYIAKFGSVANSSTCRLVTDYTGTKNLRMWSMYSNPDSGTRAVSITSGATTTAIATSDSASTTTMNVEFVGGRAQVSAKYKDVGRIALALIDQNEATLTVPVSTTGTAQVVVKPATFVASNIRNGATANPGAIDSNGAVFVRAGAPFSADVVSRDAEGTATPNFGKESPAESVKLTPTLVAPLGGATPPIAATIGFTNFSDGAASGTDFQWHEVGIIRLTPEVNDGSYLEAGPVVGATTGNVGRFIPYDFDVATTIVPSFQATCPSASGGFTYIGEPIHYATQPVVTVTARSQSGATTTNYRDSYFKLTSGASLNRTYQSAAALDVAGLPAVAIDPALERFNGTGTLTFDTGSGINSGIKFTRTTPVVPFDAQVSIAITIVDSDAVAFAGNPYVVEPSGITFLGGAEQRYGRLVMRNQVGSELINLRGLLRAEYFGPNGFVLNDKDTCTTPVTVTLSDFTANLMSADTCVINDTLGCVGPASQQFASPPLATNPGNFNAWFKAPGQGNQGSMTATANAPSWLQYNWDASTTTLENPSGKIVFGLFPGVSPNRIYQREDIVR